MSDIVYIFMAAAQNKRKLAVREVTAVLLDKCQRSAKLGLAGNSRTGRGGGCKSGELDRGLLREELASWPQPPFPIPESHLKCPVEGPKGDGHAS